MQSKKNATTKKSKCRQTIKRNSRPVEEFRFSFGKTSRNEETLSSVLIRPELWEASVISCSLCRNQTAYLHFLWRTHKNTHRCRDACGGMKTCSCTLLYRGWRSSEIKKTRSLSGWSSLQMVLCRQVAQISQSLSGLDWICGPLCMILVEILLIGFIWNCKFLFMF